MAESWLCSRLYREVVIMPLYGVYFIDRDAHISRPPEVLECADDAEATQKARQFIDGKDAELWRDGYLIAKLPRQ